MKKKTTKKKPTEDARKDWDILTMSHNVFLDWAHGYMLMKIGQGDLQGGIFNLQHYVQQRLIQAQKDSK